MRSSLITANESQAFGTPGREEKKKENMEPANLS